MTHLEQLVNTFTSIGYTFVILKQDGWTYVVLCNEDDIGLLENANPAHIYDHAMFEFDELGNWGSYP